MSRPKQLAAGEAPRMFRAGPSLLNVGDLVAERDNRLVSAAAWEGTRAEFAAAFRGVSDSHHDPRRPPAGPFPPPVVAQAGGGWEFEVRGAVKEGDPLGPAIGDGGKLLAQVLEAVPAAEAVAVMGKDGRVLVFSRPGVAPAAVEPVDGDDGDE